MTLQIIVKIFEVQSFYGLSNFIYVWKILRQKVYLSAKCQQARKYLLRIDPKKLNRKNYNKYITLYFIDI